MESVSDVRKGGRPAKSREERRTHNVVFRLNSAEVSEFNRLYSESGAPTIRKFIMDSYRRRQPSVGISEADSELFSLIKSNVRDVRMVSSNINQIAAKINSMKGDVSEKILGYEVKKAIAYLSDLAILEEKIADIALDISHKNLR